MDNKINDNKINDNKETYYVDTFEWKIVTEVSPWAAPERYYKYSDSGEVGVVKEVYIQSYSPMEFVEFHWRVDDFTDLTDNPSNVDGVLLTQAREEFFRKMGFTSTPSLYEYSVPTEWYAKTVEEFKKSGEVENL